MLLIDGAESSFVGCSKHLLSHFHDQNAMGGGHHGGHGGFDSAMMAAAIDSQQHQGQGGQGASHGGFDHNAAAAAAAYNMAAAQQHPMADGQGAPMDYQQLLQRQQMQGHAQQQQAAQVREICVYWMLRETVRLVL